MASILLITVNGLYKKDLLNKICSMLINCIFFEEKNAKLVVSIYNFINSNASIDKSVSIFSKLVASHPGFNLKQEDFPMVSCNMSIRNSICNPDKPIVKYVRKPFLKSFCTSSAIPAQPFSDTNVR